MILCSSSELFPHAIIAALKIVKCEYEVRSIESLSEWDAYAKVPFVDYKVIAVELSMETLRRALNIYVSSIFLNNSGPRVLCGSSASYKGAGDGTLRR